MNPVTSIRNQATCESSILQHGISLTALAVCDETLNPLKGLVNGFHDSYVLESKGCYYNSGRAFFPAMATTVAIASGGADPAAEGAASALADGTADAASAAQDAIPRFSGTEKPWTRGATPNSQYTQLDPKTGLPKQKAIYDENGDVIGHVDYKQHGSAAPGHGHVFPEPGNPASGHGPGRRTFRQTNYQTDGESPMIALKKPVDVRELLTRFGGFFDAVLVEVHLSLPRESARRHASLILLAQESSGAESAGRWRTVTLEVDGVSGYRLSEGPETYLVLSDGLQVQGDGEERWLVDLAPEQVASTSSGEVPAQFVAGLRCSYELGDYAS